MVSQVKETTCTLLLAVSSKLLKPSLRRCFRFHRYDKTSHTRHVSAGIEASHHLSKPMLVHEFVVIREHHDFPAGTSQATVARIRASSLVFTHIVHLGEI